MPLQIRRGTNAERLAMSVPLAQGELLYVTDDQRLYIGNGSTLGGVQITGFTAEDAQDAAASMLTNGTHAGINFTYGLTQDGANRIDATVDLSNYTGIIAADAFKGSVFADDSGLLVDAVDSKINLDGTVKGHIVPATNIVYDLGSPTNRFRDLYLKGSSIYLGDAVITVNGNAVNLPAGSTVNGVLLGSGDGVIAGSNYNINIVGDDSSLIVDSATGTLRGTFYGSLFSDDSGLIINGVDGTILLDGRVNSNIVPKSSKLFDIGSSSFNFKNLYLSDLTIENSTIKATNSPAILYIGDRENFHRVTYYSNSSDPNLEKYGLTSGLASYGEKINAARTSIVDGFQGTVAPGDRLYSIDFRGWSDATWVNSAGISVFVDPNGTVTNTAVPGLVAIGTILDGTLSSASGLIIDRNGQVGINRSYTEQLGAELDINGTLKLAPLSEAPTSPSPGMIAVADGTGWDPFSTGKQTMVIYLGSAWVQIAAAA